MADRSTSPSYCKQARKRGTPLAYVELDGIRYYLGAYGTPESRERYHRLLAEWNAAGTQKRPEPSEITIIELCARYMRNAEQYYRSSNGKPTSELHCFVTVVRLLTGLYGRMNASEFGPLALKTIRDQMINADWVRSHVNKQVSRIKMIFKWGVAEELVSPSVQHALSAVTGLKLGRSRARESEPVKPVSETHIEAIRPHVAPQVWALIELQLLTGARSGELVQLRLCDLDRSNANVWIFRPPHHKTRHHGHERTVFFGPRAQEIVAPFIAGKTPTDYVFSPLEAEKERLQRRHAKRRTPLSCGNTPSPSANTERLRAPGDHYTQESYRRAIARACERAGVPSWHPHQLRHNAATRFRHEYGLEAAQVLLGHRKADITQVYAEVNIERAVKIVERIG